MTHFEKIKAMNIDGFAKFLIDDTKFPSSPCYVCEFDEGLNCICPVECTKEYKARVYRKWLEKVV